jgi:hypothetical protein
MRGASLFLALTCAAQVYQIETVAGTGRAGFSGDRGPAYFAELNTPSAVALDDAGRILIADSGNNRVRRVELNGQAATFAGNRERAHSGDGGRATEASIIVSDIAVGPEGTVYIAGGDAVRAVDRAGMISTVAAGIHAVNSVIRNQIENTVGTRRYLRYRTGETGQHDIGECSIAS